MTWYNVRLVSRDPAGREFYMEANSEDEVEQRTYDIYGDELEILDLTITKLPSDDVPDEFEGAGSNIAFDSEGNKL